MPTGFVCQLHYHGGGKLVCQTSTGDSWQLPFARAPPHVRIGHTVSFSLAADRAVLAVNLQAIQEEAEKAATSSADSEVGLQSIQDKAAEPLLSLAKQPTRKLQRSITRFRNADLEEKLGMIEAAEALLDNLLNEVAAVLQPSEPSDLQRRVRRLLISALSSLDLSDITTYQAVETAVLYILQLMQGKDTVFSGNAKSLATRQWRQLRELLVADDAQHGPTKRKASDGTPEIFEDKASRMCPHNRWRAYCKECGGGGICPHNRRRTLC
eukprot:s487_g14.t1